MMRAWLVRDPTGGTVLCIFSESEICKDLRNGGCTRGGMFSEKTISVDESGWHLELNEVDAKSVQEESGMSQAKAMAASKYKEAADATTSEEHLENRVIQTSGPWLDCI